MEGRGCCVLCYGEHTRVLQSTTAYFILTASRDDQVSVLHSFQGDAIGGGRRVGGERADQGAGRLHGGAVEEPWRVGVSAFEKAITKSQQAPPNTSMADDATTSKTHDS